MQFELKKKTETVLIMVILKTTIKRGFSYPNVLYSNGQPDIWSYLVPYRYVLWYLLTNNIFSFCTGNKDPSIYYSEEYWRQEEWKGIGICASGWIQVHFSAGEDSSGWWGGGGNENEGSGLKNNKKGREIGRNK